ncbi:hypothetical protein GCM10018966_013660 [Streptomyces yanii]
MDPALTALNVEYTIDRPRASFTVRHAMVTNVRGSFGDHEGSLTLDGANPMNSAASIDVKIASVAPLADRDGHLVSGDFSTPRSSPS